MIVTVSCILTHPARWFVYGIDNNNNTTSTSTPYGLDCSFPIHAHEIQCSSSGSSNKDFGRVRQAAYNVFLQGCQEKYGRRKQHKCIEREDARIELNVRQPQSIVNYTRYGYKILPVPTELYETLYEHWEKQTKSSGRQDEIWQIGDTSTNHWHAPTYLVSLEEEDDNNNNENNEQGRRRRMTRTSYSRRLKKRIYDATQSAMEQWTGMEQKPTSMYGIRQYTTGAIIPPHVERLPKVCSCIINVAEDTDEPWPLELYTKQGVAMNVTIPPGYMILYESASVIHGRPFPLHGRYVAEMYIHFEPTGHTVHSDFYPPYLVRDSPEFPDWVQQHPSGWSSSSSSSQNPHSNNNQYPSAAIMANHPFKSPTVHVAAANGDVESLEQLGRINSHALTRRDVNGWQPIHEAARGGYLESLITLVNFGVDLNARTGPDQNGHTPLNLAIQHLGEDHEVVVFLRSLKAKDLTFGEEL